MHKPVDGAEALAREVLEREALASGDYASISFEEHGWNPWPVAVRAMLAHSAALVAENERLAKALKPFARQNPHKSEEGSAGVLVPATIADVRAARTALETRNG